VYNTDWTDPVSATSANVAKLASLCGEKLYCSRYNYDETTIRLKRDLRALNAGVARECRVGRIAVAWQL